MVEDTLTMPRLLALHKEWRKNPPIALLIKAFMGIKDEPDAALPSGKPAALPEFANLPEIEE